ncbi:MULTISPECIES: DUF3080 family protein [unclassified Methylophaga]|jgi:hypothetical protein|uniref:DUF3080 family protein n=1 Tax=unclassified Methylophaga TaxID=2629249 RepID=UPI0025E22DE3|nr:MULTISPECIES: DUF3080 family protein [unclassified Methylophaga]|tara:strand:- start:133 stop:1188 length:1056 start_codon:yes stop_codon:yes gene_type:complete
MNIPSRILVLFSLVLLLGACDPLAKPETMMDEYVKRLANVLDVEPVYSDLIDIERIPRPRERRLSIPEHDINMLDFLSLYGCELQFVVGEKNSILGRVMQPLNNLRYELRFIEASQQCLVEIKSDSLRTKLAQVIEIKKQYLPRVIWNATWGTDEIAQLMSLSSGLYDPEQSQYEISSYSQDIVYVNKRVQRLLQGQYEQDLEYMGEIQQRWQYGSRAGQLQNSARLLISRLDDGTQILKQRIEQKPLCVQGRLNTQAKILESMFFKVYIEKVQPYMSAVNSGADQLFQPLARLAQMQKEVMPQTFNAYYQQTLNVDNKQNIWTLYQQRIKEHTEAWQDLLEQCGLRPTPD